jgi:hypothetical protein
MVCTPYAFRQFNPYRYFAEAGGLAKLRGERDDKVTMHAHEIIRHDNQPASRFSA